MQERIVYVPLPESLLMSFYGWVGQQKSISGPDGSREAESESEGFWNREKIERLRREYQNRAVRTLFDLCADRPGQDVAGREAEKAADIKMPTLRAGLAGLTMFLKKRFGARGAQDWPITWSYQDGFAVYRMSPRVAAWWKSRA